MASPQSFEMENNDSGVAQMLSDGVPVDVRAGFIRKVYMLLAVQLLLTAAIAAPIASADQQWVLAHRQLCNAAMMGSIAAVIGVGCCCQEVARKFPQNYLFLFFVTACEAVMVGFVCAAYTGQSVLLAAGMTSGIFLGLSMYAMTTTTDFTGMGGYLSAAITGLLMILLFGMFFPSPFLQTLIGGCGAILFSFYIVYDTQLIVGGKHSKNQFSVDDYVFAALNIYLDIINLFLYILSLFGDRR